MFAPRYFGHRYFGERYFGDGDAASGGGGGGLSRVEQDLSLGLRTGL
jgi:hypothetical protein